MSRIFALVIFGATSLVAQVGSERDLFVEMQARERIAAEIASGKSSTATALNSLGSGKAGTTSDAEFAFAASDIGRRLLAAGKPVQAEECFRASEKALGASLTKAEGRERARSLADRALLRAMFLGNPDGAKVDITEALTLAPDDSALKAVARNVERGHGKKDPAPPTRFVTKPWERGN